MNQIRTVVNKVNEIDNTYRNFAFEVLAGETDTLVTVKENNCEFKFDFAKVYWNPRLGTEHERVVNILETNDVVYDVFAGVGPFSVPAVTCRKVSAVLANDLNPNSFKYLVENYQKNNNSKIKKRDLEVRKQFISKTMKVPSPPVLVDKEEKFKFDPTEIFAAYNLDGKQFIRTKLKYHLVEMLHFKQVNNSNEGNFYVLMNLPAMSIEFLDSFWQLYDSEETSTIKARIDDSWLNRLKLNIFCYHFCKNSNEELDNIKKRIASEIFNDPELLVNSKFVRKVAPNKDMFCSMFQLGFKHLLSKKNKLDEKQAESDAEKKPKIE
jgi:tRNA (guanine37-N1)-methyltransferase